MATRKCLELVGLHSNGRVIRGSRERTTVREFVHANTGPDVWSDRARVNKVKRLRIGQSVIFGGGAAAVTRVKRVACHVRRA